MSYNVKMCSQPKIIDSIFHVSLVSVFYQMWVWSKLNEKLYCVSPAFISYNVMNINVQWTSLQPKNIRFHLHCVSLIYLKVSYKLSAFIYSAEYNKVMRLFHVGGKKHRVEKNSGFELRDLFLTLTVFS